MTQAGQEDGHPLWMLSARDLSTAYANGLTPADVAAATLAHIDDINPRLNAIVTLDVNGALRAAEGSTRRWQAGQPLSALDGVPVTIKDNILVAGLRATWGSRLYSDYVPDHDELPVQRLREAGAIILGKTNVPEFTVHGFTHNQLFGTTRNPWDISLTPGGSSGGAVAAVASGMGALALGTDGGGSIRRPAAHTGLVGLKPSRGMVPRGQGFPAILHDFEVVGPIARCIDDVIMAMDVIAGPTWRARVNERKSESRRIAYAPTFGDAPVDPVIAKTMEAAIAQLQAFGYRIETIAPFELAAPLSDIWPIISQTGVAWLLSQHKDWQETVAPAIADMAAAGAAYSARDYLNALGGIASMRLAFEALFARYDFLMTPTTAAMPWPAANSHPQSIDGKAVGPRGHAIFTPVANALGLPAISVPCQVADGAMPIGLQVLAGWDRDRHLLDFARMHEGSVFRHRWPPLAHRTSARSAH